MTSIHASGLAAPEGAEPTSVYRYYDEHGVLIYVGITKQGMGRNLQHNGHAEWWQFVVRQEVEHLPTRKVAADLERDLIRRHQPPFNKQHNPNCADIRANYLIFMTAPTPSGTAHEQFDALRTSSKRARRWLPLDGPFPYGAGAVFLTKPEHSELAGAILLRHGPVPIFEMTTGAPTGEVFRIQHERGLVALRCADASGISPNVHNPRALIQWQRAQRLPTLVRVFMENAEGPVAG